MNKYGTWAEEAFGCRRRMEVRILRRRAPGKLTDRSLFFPVSFHPPLDRIGSILIPSSPFLSFLGIR